MLLAEAFLAGRFTSCDATYLGRSLTDHPGASVTTL